MPTTFLLNSLKLIAQHLTQVDHGEGDVVSTHEVDIFTVETEQQRPKLINPGKGTLVGKAMSVDLRIEQPLAALPGMLAIPAVLSDVGYQAMVEAHLACRSGIEGAVGVEVCTLKVKPQTFHESESRL